MDSHYRLTCLRCGRSYAESEAGFRLGCDAQHEPALLRAEYAESGFRVEPREAGLFRYRRWLPIRRTFPEAGRTVVFHSRRLGDRLRLDALFLAFSGYWPERDAGLETCSFKELEALPVCARVPAGQRGALVVSSAGNTGRSFLQVGSRCAVPVLVVVPECALSQMWLTGPQHPEVRLAVVRGADYLDAITLGNRIAALPGYFPEGGARNVARRDGMGTVVLSAAETLGELPRHYFQAVGSGTGAIAAWEMDQRLAAAGRGEGRRMRLHLVQNSPFTVMSDAWARGERELACPEEERAKQAIAQLHSPVLSNREPPYGIVGGVYDALCDTQGQTYSVSCAEARAAGRLFEELEGCDLDPAAEVALAGLLQAVERGRVDRRESILLNLTGGGARRLRREGRHRAVRPDFTFTSPRVGERELAETLNTMQGVRA